MQELPAELRGSTAILRIRFDKHFRRQLKIDFREDRSPTRGREIRTESQHSVTSKYTGRG